jgi:hypothetical protein
MNILILEDNEERNKQFRKNFNDHYIVIVDDVEDLKIQMEDPSWEVDVLFLDHDLGGEVYVDTSHPNTGSAAAMWLVDNPKHKPEVVILHSMNPIGVRNMKSILPKAYIVDRAWQRKADELFRYVDCGVIS